MSIPEQTIAEPEKWVESGDYASFFTFVTECLRSCLQKDKYKIKARLHRIRGAFNDSEKQVENLDSVLGLLAELERSRQRYQVRKNNIPKTDYPDLPVSERRDDILEAIQNHQVVIIAGETGSGKTTQLPKICIDAGRGITGLIAHTQPRRLAARSVATRIAEELSTPLGEKVGFKIRFSDQVSDNTYIKLMTDGMLLAEMQQDRFLDAYDTIIIDEAHERSLNIDFLLGYLKQLLAKRPDLKVIITSATIDPERFSKHFSNAPIIEVSGRTYPVEIRYMDTTDNNENDQIDNIIHGVDELMLAPKGDILVFLSGERDIRDTQDALSKQQYKHTEIVPLFARLSANEQNKIFQSHSGRRIVLATNVAETSLTVPGIKYVIDPGTARVSRYSARLKVQRLPIEPISQASANQRAGRCGRVSDGICIRLYSEDDYLSRPEFTDPEILRTNLASVILQMMALGLGEIEQFPFVQPPDNRNITDGYRLLEELQATQLQKGKQVLTAIGRQLSRLPVDPRFARMVIEAGKNDALTEVIVIAAGLSIQDPRERPQDKKQKADEAHKHFADKHSDFIALLNLWNAFSEQQTALSNSQIRKWCKSQFINYLRMREWQDIVSQIKKSLSNVQLGLNSTQASFDSIHKSLLAGLLSHIGMKDKEKGYLGARNSQFYVFPGSELAKKPPKWVMSAELVETSRLFARMNASIDPAWVEPLAKHMTKSSFSEPHWSKSRGAVVAYEKVMLLGIPIVAKRAVNYSNIDAPLCQSLFVREALVNGDTKLNIAVLKDNQNKLAEAEAVEQKTRQRDWVVSEDDLVNFYQSRIPDNVVSEASFLKWWKHKADQQGLVFTEKDIFQKSPTSNVQNAFPDSWKQGQLNLPLRYEFEPNAVDDGVTLVVPLPVLNQLTSDGFDWLVPGLRLEKLTALIKSLPKRLRKNFVPAPNFAEAVLPDLVDVDKKGHPVALIDALALKLFRMTGVKVEREDWQLSLLPKHLTMHFSIVDGNGKQLAFGDDLFTLQENLSGKVKETFEKAVTPEFERKGLTKWDFETLPETFTQKHGGFDVKAYPALVKNGNTVDIVLLDSEIEAQKNHFEGVAALLKLAMPSPVKYLQEKLPNKAKLGLYFNPFGKIQALIDDCILAGIYSLIDEFVDFSQASLRTKDGFTQCENYVRGRLNDEVLAIAVVVEKGLTLAHGIQKQMKGNVPLTLIQSVGHIKIHLDSLVYAGFASDFRKAKLNDWLRYLQALEKRLEKAKIDPQRDKLNQLSVDKVNKSIESAKTKIVGNEMEPTFNELRWMTEELRVSLFAQQLGTAYPISEKRILNFIQSECG
ncbi:ATP-dependent RNA helicase HrpA [Alteromonas sp. 5E99-2]|uniref:ATP-dependent RNA helicase HrpA n=1 Tax=Alteromonas sp. 5E99-2 TaxID=2817683 RepID=UPI001A97EC1F|nr:ATP-dependent RNA helicase HrpA [Alteromonas sp. 5E99-2]MBO1254938.1 ATP-dependent RNA helicase HrpA [Alteromonas sp. 5E99-2]